MMNKKYNGTADKVCPNDLRAYQEFMPHVYAGTQDRQCLKCNRRFQTENRFIRICNYCKEQDKLREQRLGERK